MMKMIRWCLLLGVVFGAGYYTGKQPDLVKKTLRDLSGEVLESTIGLDQTVQLKRQMVEAKEGFVEGRAYLLDHDFEGASEEFSRALHHLDEAVALDPEGPMAKRIEIVKLKVQEVQKSLAQGRSIPPHILEDLREELRAVLP